MAMKSIWRACIAAWMAAASVGGAAAATVPEGADFATDVVGDAWDFASQSDVYPLLWTHNLASATVSGGTVKGVARDTDPHLWLLFPQIPSAIPTANKPTRLIDATRYNVLTFRMKLPDTVVAGSRQGRLVWHRGGTTVAAFDAAYNESQLISVYPGWHTYRFDLDRLPMTRGTPWGGTIHGLRIDPCLGCQIEFEVDWARLSPRADATAGVTLSAGRTRLLVSDDLTSPNPRPMASLKAGAANRVSTAELPPGTYKTAAVTDGDWALAERGRAWDMSSTSDFGWASNNGFANATVANGVFSGRTNGADPFLLMDIPLHTSIDTSQYRHIAIDITVGSLPPQTSGLVVWWGAQPAVLQYASGFQPLTVGRQTIRIDLGAQGNWAGLMRALRIDPIKGPNAGSNVQITLHSVRLTKTAGFVENVAWDTEPLVVNAKPNAQVLSPSFGTGTLDYATAEKGTPWNMAGTGVQQPQQGNLQAWRYTNRIDDLGLNVPVFQGTSLPAAPGTTEGDPHAFLVFQENAAPIDADRYRWLGFDLYVPFNPADQNELTVGSVMRLAWKDSDLDPGLTSDDILLMPGYATYWFDMASLRYEPASNRRWAGLVRYLRIDPFEFPTPRSFFLGPARLMAQPQGRFVVPVALQLSDADADTLSVQIVAGSTVLASRSGVAPGRLDLVADLSALPLGEHILVARISDGRNSRDVALPLPVQKIAGTTPQAASELAAIDRIYNWAQVALGLPPVASSGSAGCALPTAFARRYAVGCLMAIDGAVFFTVGAGPLTYAGTVADFLAVAQASGF
jgi:hypothetical protein